MDGGGQEKSILDKVEKAKGGVTEQANDPVIHGANQSREETLPLTDWGKVRNKKGG